MTNSRDLARRFSLVFDLDGTLVDSAADLHAAVNSVLPRYGLRLSLIHISEPTRRS